MGAGQTSLRKQEGFTKALVSAQESMFIESEVMLMGLLPDRCGWGRTYTQWHVLSRKPGSHKHWSCIECLKDFTGAWASSVDSGIAVVQKPSLRSVRIGPDTAQLLLHSPRSLTAILPPLDMQSCVYPMITLQMQTRGSPTKVEEVLRKVFQ